jgi:hypothetical protein
MSDQSDDHEVGYGKPPKATQFKKGRSGNPNGRPKGAKGVKANLRRDLETKITIREGNREIKIPKAEAVAKRLIANALKGDIKPVLELVKLDDELFGNGDTAPAAAATLTSPEQVDYDLLRDFFAADDDAPDNADGEDDNDGS